MSAYLTTVLLRVVKANARNTKQIRCYARWSHRHPRRVLTPEQYNKIEEKYLENANQTDDEKTIELNPETDFQTPRKEPPKLKHKWVPQNVEANAGIIDMNELDQLHDKSSNPKPKVVTKKKVVNTVTKSKTSTDMLETVIDANGDYIYTKLKDNDPAVGQLLLTVKSHKEQIKKDLALFEGKRLIKDALEARCTLKNLIFSRKSDIEFLKPLLPKSGAKLYKIPYREIQMWSDLTNSPGVMGIFKTPDVHNFEPKNCLPITIICDNIREPGNLGAVFRTAAGVGVQNVFLTKGCVDLWDTKVLRSACGAHFRLRIHKRMTWPAIQDQINKSQSTVFIADNKVITEIQNQEETFETSLKDIVLSMPLLPYYGVQFNDFQSVVLIIGGETEGISEESYRLAADFNGVRLNIPLNNNIDSLNTGTALGVILFEIKRQLLLANQENKIHMSL